MSRPTQRPRDRWASVVSLTLVAALTLCAGAAQAKQIWVGAHGLSPQQALASAEPGDVVELPRGRWSGPLLVDKAVTLRGHDAIVDGHGKGTVIRVTAANSTIEGLTIQGSGDDLGKPDACIYVTASATGAVVRGNHLRECAFGIWIHETDGAHVEANVIHGRKQERPADRGNGIQLFNASHLVVRGNRVSEARDGIYVSATEDSRIEDNFATNLRYGVHYMFSYRNTIRGNHCTDNEIGLALMESRELIVTDNVALRNVRNGLLFRDVQYTTISRNVLEHNGFAMFFFSSTENVIEDNRVAFNDVGFKVWAGTLRNRISGNVIIGNREQVFYVGSEDQVWGNDAPGNIWGDYFGWDQNGDGIGDRPYRVDSFQAKLLYQFPAAALLLRSPALELLAHLADILPIFRPPTIIDLAPQVRRGPT